MRRRGNAAYKKNRPEGLKMVRALPVDCAKDLMAC